MKPIKTSNAKCGEFVTSRMPFVANNLHGEMRGDVYVVYSYGWYPLFAYIGGAWHENSERYSVSTSKQRTQCCPSGERIQVTHAELKELITNKSMVGA